MKTASDYKATQRAILLAGPPGCGKSNLLLEFPRIWVADGDNNLGGAISRHPSPPATYWWDSIDTDEHGSPLADELKWPRLLALTEQALRDPQVLCIAWDSLTTVSTALENWVIAQPSAEKPLVVSGVRCMSQSMWRPFAMQLTKAVVDIRSRGKLFLLTSHLKTERDDLTGAVSYQPYLSGKMATVLAGLFTDYWHMRPLSGLNAQGQMVVKYQIESQPTSMAVLKNSFGLPATFEFSWAAFAPYFARATKGLQAPGQQAQTQTAPATPAQEASSATKPQT